ncbi:hypothetical protein FRC07_010735 [Ceratobasidium sp. 392]|nr:hypothetical protein FRC07_010735 [Ceratobasidium sp. 392]
MYLREAPTGPLSEASKMLRRIEKGLNNERRKSQVASANGQAPFPISSSRTSNDFNFAGNSDGFMDPSLNKNAPNGPRSQMPSSATTPTATEATPAPSLANGPPSRPGTAVVKASSPPHHMDGDNSDDDDDKEPSDDGLFPARLLARENRRNSFFRTILNPADANAEGGHSPDDTKPSMDNRQTSVASTATVHPIITGPEDPISAGLMDEAQAKVLFDLVFLRLNPFINLFDPVLHTVPYVRSRCPFLFTCLVMAGCKFWKPELFKQTQRIANEFVVKAFADQWKRVEVVQAFACMTYWKEPEDTRTYTYIGYASRMAVELGLNRYLAKAPEGETELQKRERRNRERTYLVLFVHDRSLAMQTGRQWMLPECDLVRHSLSWHEDNFIRPEDVIVCAFVQLRRIAAETTDVFYLHKGAPGLLHADVNYEILLRGCNSKLTQWMDLWHAEMKKAGGQMFHFSMLAFFRLHASPSYTGEQNGPPSYHPPLASGTHPTAVMQQVQQHGGPNANGNGAGMPNGNGLMYSQQPNGMVGYSDDMFPFPSSPHLPMHPQMNEHNQEMAQPQPQQHQQAHPNPYSNGMQMQHQQAHQQMISQQQQQQQQQQHHPNQPYNHMYGNNMPTAAATASDQHYWRNMFIELGFGGPEPTVTGYSSTIM